MITGNEPAFASVGYGPSGDSYMQPGLTKREYFAAMIMANQSMEYGANESSQMEAAKVSVMAADALIEQLNKNHP